MRIILIIGLFLSSLSYGDSPALPISYLVESENGKYIFAMISPLDRDVELSSLNDQWMKKISKIRDQYSQSGMYLNDGSKKPLWSVSWYAHSVQVANDGEHIVRDGPWASSFSDEAVTFIKNGNVLREYSVNDLVMKKRKVERTVSHFFWRKETLFDRKQLKYYISTLDSKHYVFNVATGQVSNSGK
ncbi:hypothetical protein [Teredinibacter turnerae]|uniref:hypothetical protein n=1 Tax=Teredinibacter turnerae TaxID=2426 RepID=UPI00048F683D|nr:hypothetical protein [Teredinibacter turnerae]